LTFQPLETLTSSSAAGLPTEWTPMTDTPLVSCIGCGGQVPGIDGPTHVYMRASPGCWHLYGQLIAQAQDRVHVDCYAAQHPGGAEHDRRQRQSVAVHLISLCLLLEHHRHPDRGRMSRTVLPRRGLDDWPYLPPPATLGTVTVANAGLDLESWAKSVWTAWSAHHGTVRNWAEAA
jgi:hypothetical protein